MQPSIDAVCAPCRSSGAAMMLAIEHGHPISLVVECWKKKRRWWAWQRRWMDWYHPSPLDDVVGVVDHGTESVPALDEVGGGATRRRRHLVRSASTC